ncbi:MAG TPA: RDD family protein [Planctomicrobium sp.]|nr:RDD family protein [Planctomicrobium sp.]
MNSHEENFSVRNVIVRTPENLEIKYDLAGAGTRAVAFLVDAALMYFIVSLLQGLITALVLPIGKEHPIYAGAAMGVITFVFFNGYFILFEMLWAGQSPGKRVVGIRVVKKGGYSLRLIDSLIRNLLRTVDLLPVCYGVGLVTVLSTRYSQRLGDLVAGTLVVYENQVPSRSPFSTSSVEKVVDETFALPQLQLSSLPSDVIEACDEFLRIKFELAPAPRQQIANDLVFLIEKLSGLTPNPRQSDEAFLYSVVTGGASSLS